MSITASASVRLGAAAWPSASLPERCRPWRSRPAPPTPGPTTSACCVCRRSWAPCTTCASCAASNDGQAWRDRMRELMDAEGSSALRRAKLTRSFNNGYRSYSRTYNACTPVGADGHHAVPHRGLRDRRRSDEGVSVSGVVSGTSCNFRAARLIVNRCRRHRLPTAVLPLPMTGASKGRLGISRRRRGYGGTGSIGHAGLGFGEKR